MRLVQVQGTVVREYEGYTASVPFPTFYIDASMYACDTAATRRQARAVVDAFGDAAEVNLTLMTYPECEFLED